MNSMFYLRFCKIFLIAAFLNAALSLVAVCINAERILTICSVALVLACLGLACVFYIIYRNISDKEDLEIIKEVDKYLKEKNRDE